MDHYDSEKRLHPKDVVEAFSSGLVTATGERVFIPLRKRGKLESEHGTNTHNGIDAYSDLSSISVLSDDDIRLLRMQHRIRVEGDDIVGPILKFSNIGLPVVLLKKLSNMNIVIPKPVQMQGIPLILSGRDVVIHSETGSGKTLTFLLPLLMQLCRMPLSTPETGPIALIIVPRRELARQILTEIAHFTISPLDPEFTLRSQREEDINLSLFTADGRLHHRSLGIWGGEDSPIQQIELSKGVDVIVCTPGRLIDLIGKEYVSLQHIQYLVLDEADECCRQEMENQIRTLVQMIPDNHSQTILCSATFPIEVMRLINSCITHPITVRVNSDGAGAGGLSKDVTIQTYIVTFNTRFEKLLDILRSISAPPVLIFVNSIAAIDQLVNDLKQEQFHVCGIHSEYPQELRSAIVRAFREGGIDILISSSLLERGLDFDIDDVILYEMPESIEKVKHRAGRTGRGGRKGNVTVLIMKGCKIMKDYKRLLKECKQLLPNELE